MSKYRRKDRLRYLSRRHFPGAAPLEVDNTVTELELGSNVVPLRPAPAPDSWSPFRKKPAG